MPPFLNFGEVYMSDRNFIWFLAFLVTSVFAFGCWVGYKRVNNMHEENMLAIQKCPCIMEVNK